MSNSNWYPEIMYEEAEGGTSSKIPFVLVPEGEVMPSLLYVFESRETGEFEPGPEGEMLPMMEMDLHQYADMSILKQKLDEETYDTVRMCFNLKPLREASEAGRKITNNVRENLREKTIS